MLAAAGLLDGRPWGGQELAVDPCHTLFNPAFHPIDFVPIGAADIGIGVDSLAHDSPAVEVAALRLLQFGSHLVDALVNSHGGKFVGAELSPAIDAALHEVGILPQPSIP